VARSRKSKIVLRRFYHVNDDLGAKIDHVDEKLGPRVIVLVEKHGNGRVTMRESLQVRFAQLEDTEPG
jgi:hypothetical protein